MDASRQPKVVTVGDNCIDRYIEPIDADFPGGNALNVAVFLAQEGFPATYVGVLGDDAEGRFMMASITAMGVEPAVVIKPGASGVTVLQLLDGDRTFLNEDYGVGESLSTTDLPLGEHLRPGTGWLHAARLRDAERLGNYRVADCPISYDFTDEFTREELERVCPVLDVAFMSLPNGPAQDTEQTMRMCADAGAGVVVVTQGALGSVATSDGRSFHRHAAPKLEVRDSLGAGDAFIAGFIRAQLAGSTLQDCLRLATEATRPTLGRYGAWCAEGIDPADFDISTTVATDRTL